MHLLSTYYIPGILMYMILSNFYVHDTHSIK